VTSTRSMPAAKRPRSRLAGGYGHPTHPILVTVPIGAWVASLFFDLASHVVDDPDFLARGSLWLIGLGVVGALVAGVAGSLDLVGIPSGTAAFRTGLLHLSLNVLVILTYVGNFSWRKADNDTVGAVPGGPLLLSVVSLLVLAASGYLGGKLAYRYGVRVVDEATQATGFGSPEPAHEPVTAPPVGGGFVSGRRRFRRG
jgi:uncharacterized membrane protein